MRNGQTCQTVCPQLTESSFSALRYADVAQVRPEYVACSEKTREIGSELPSNERFSCFQDGGSTPDRVMQCNGNSSVAHVSGTKMCARPVATHWCAPLELSMLRCRAIACRPPQLSHLIENAKGPLETCTPCRHRPSTNRVPPCSP